MKLLIFNTTHMAQKLSYITPSAVFYMPALVGCCDICRILWAQLIMYSMLISIQVVWTLYPPTIYSCCILFPNCLSEELIIISSLSIVSMCALELRHDGRSGTMDARAPQAPLTLT
ncbi:hypothetical protein BDW42DRAFT_90308 [Aspergillus taichungensis]|uniref:Uncharacterized protein n=1 Tax=Aspergillus taichungensis TaxID=482145 RepID=A0A2J5HWR9_9EURO|nr:hypothetical protein BDW42DRAFT_90308 [Aspergillus taichungensis]